MSQITENETRLDELKKQLDSVVGTETEVYTRIVGYYRSVRNWNPGKREEYRHRAVFNPDTDRLPAEVVRAEPPVKRTVGVVGLKKLVVAFGEIGFGEPAGAALAGT